MTDKNGFVMAEFVIALPLLILLLFSLGSMTFQIFKLAKAQVADYVLETEAQNILNRITEDARAAYSVKVKSAVGGGKIDEIFFNYCTVTNSPQMMAALKTPRRYTVGATGSHGYHVYAERQEKGAKSNPISGGNFFGDTTVTLLKFSEPSENVLHITLELQSTMTDRKFKVNTSVFMPACKEKVGL